MVLNYGLRLDAMRILRMGMRRDVFALQKNDALSPFGPKLIAALEPPTDKDLLHGSLVVSFELAEWPDLRKLSDPEVLRRADDLRQRLLGFRFHHLKSVRFFAGVLPAHFGANTRELIRCLAAPFAEDEESCARLASAMSWACAPTQAIPARQGAVLSAL